MHFNVRSPYSYFSYTAALSAFKIKLRTSFSGAVPMWEFMRLFGLNFVVPAFDREANHPIYVGELPIGWEIPTVHGLPTFTNFYLSGVLRHSFCFILGRQKTQRAFGDLSTMYVLLTPLSEYGVQR